MCSLLNVNYTTVKLLTYWLFRINLKTMVHPYNEIPLGNNKEQTTDMHNGINESQKHYAE